MEETQFLDKVINNLQFYKLAVLVLAFSFWGLGYRFLIKKHTERLRSENIEFKDNIQLHNITGKEWFAFTLFLISAFGLLVLAVNI